MRDEEVIRILLHFKQEDMKEYGQQEVHTDADRENMQRNKAFIRALKWVLKDDE